MEEKQGTISDIIFYNKGNSYTIAIMEAGAEEITIVGNLPMAEVGRSFFLKGDRKSVV